MDLKSKIRSINDFPQEGIIFRDITTVLKDGEAFSYAIEEMHNACKEFEFDLICGPESRGFIFGTPISYIEKKGFIPIRKPGKLPAETISQEYDLEYGTSKLEIHKDAIKPGQRVIIVDDLLATGGTAEAIAKLVEKCGGVVAGFVFFIELEFLEGRQLLKDYDVVSIVKY